MPVSAQGASSSLTRRTVSAGLAGVAIDMERLLLVLVSVVSSWLGGDAWI